MIGRLFSKLWRILNLSRIIILNLLFFTLLFIFIAAIASDKDEIIVPNNSALVLNLKGAIVEQKQHVNPADAFMAEAMEQGDDNPEVLLADILYALETAKNDDRINTLVLKLGKLQNSGLSKLQDVGAALIDFKSSGKKIIAVGDQFSQAQYYLASHADNVWLNPKGWLLFEGFNSYQMYFKTALEKLSINQHIFRVGTYKSAVEPFMRDDMSPAAKEANLLWLNDLWSQYKHDVAKLRNISLDNFDDNAQVLLKKIEAVNGSVAEYALQNNWVDELKTRVQMQSSLIEMVGKNKKGDSYSHIGYKDYLSVISTNKIPTQVVETKSDKVAVIVAKGTILNESM